MTLVRDLRDYVEVSVRLGRAANRGRLEAQREALRAGRWSSPMFDTRRSGPPPPPSRSPPGRFCLPAPLAWAGFACLGRIRLPGPGLCGSLYGPCLESR